MPDIPKCLHHVSGISYQYYYPGPRGFFLPRRDEMREKEAVRDFLTSLLSSPLHALSHFVALNSLRKTL